MKLSHSRIEQTLAERGFSHGEFSRRLGITLPSLSESLRRIKDGRESRPTTAHKYAKALKVKVAEIMERATPTT